MKQVSETTVWASCLQAKAKGKKRQACCSERRRGVVDSEGERWSAETAYQRSEVSGVREKRADWLTYRRRWASRPTAAPRLWWCVRRCWRRRPRPRSTAASPCRPSWAEPRWRAGSPDPESARTTDGRGGVEWGGGRGVRSWTPLTSPLPHPEREETAATIKPPAPQPRNCHGNRHEHSVIHDCQKQWEAVAVVTVSLARPSLTVTKAGLKEDSDSPSASGFKHQFIH